MTDPATERRFNEARRIPRAQPADDAGRRLRRINRLAWVLDRSIPIGNWRIGLDPIIGLVPGLGDWVGAVLSLYILYEGARLGVGVGVLVRMTANILVETIFGAVPVLGDLFDFGWQANSRNMELIQRHYRPELKPRSLNSVVAAVGAVAFVILALVGFLGYLAIKGVIELWRYVEAAM